MGGRSGYHLPDINMPHMNGWEFMAEYVRLEKDLQSKVIICMLSTSENPDDKLKFKEYNMISEYITKPLTIEALNLIANKYFLLKSPFQEVA